MTRKTILFLIIVIILVGGLVSGGFWYFSKEKQRESIDYSTYENKSENFTIQYPENWEIKQPSVWGVVTFYDPDYTEPGTEHWPYIGAKVNILIVKDPRKDPPNIHMERLKKIMDVNPKKISIDGMTAFEVEKKVDFYEQTKKDAFDPELYETIIDLCHIKRGTIGSIPMVWIPSKKAGRYFEITLLYPCGIKDQEFDRIFDHMISTFNFIH